MERNDSNLKKHSEFGKTSFIFSIISITLCFGTLIYMAISLLKNSVNTDTEYIIISLVVIISLLLSLIGIVLSINGSKEITQKNTFTNLGMIFNASVIIIYIMLYTVVTMV